MTSQDIYLCTTIDRLAATEACAQPSFDYFVGHVSAATISVIDDLNWQEFKTQTTRLGNHHRTIAAAILAVQALYKALKLGVPVSKAVYSLHDAARAAFRTMLSDEAEPVTQTLHVALLLSLFEMLVFDETGLTLTDPEMSLRFVEKLKATHHLLEPQDLRISAWLRLLHASGRRGGNPGLLSESLLRNLPDHATIPSTPHIDPRPRESLLRYLGAPLFDFRVHLETISTQVAELSHYHRSRITPADQDEVALEMQSLKNRLYQLWHHRPDICRLAPTDIYAYFAEEIARPLITAIGIANAAYYTEIIETGRTLSDPPLASSEAKSAMAEIRKMVEAADEWNLYNDQGHLSAGYLRPLFLYAIESIRKEDTLWAVQKLREIKDPICRSDLFATFADGLTEAQRSKGRRVTTKFFCRQNYGISPPFC
ncbi:hypothetical protein AYO22_11720 [Fonsecaea multimorphosa]|nr:hypothetical protein AYO22_11720 [Fonsecaea multimorphosa]